MDNEKSVSVSSQIEDVNFRKKRDYVIILFLILLLVFTLGYIIYDLNSKYNQKETFFLDTNSVVTNLDNSYYEYDRNKLFFEFQYIGTEDLYLNERGIVLIFNDTNKVTPKYRYCNLLYLKKINSNSSNYISNYADFYLSTGDILNLEFNCIYLESEFGFVEGNIEISTYEGERKAGYQREIVTNIHKLDSINGYFIFKKNG